MKAAQPLTVQPCFDASGEPMPNSAGCVHSYLPSIKAIWQTLVTKCGVEVRPNTGGKRPYPHKPQGVVAVYEVEN
jgi:hypothetical protein